MREARRLAPSRSCTWGSCNHSLQDWELLFDHPKRERKVALFSSLMVPAISPARRLSNFLATFPGCGISAIFFRGGLPMTTSQLAHGVRRLGRVSASYSCFLEMYAYQGTALLMDIWYSLDRAQ